MRSNNHMAFKGLTYLFLLLLHMAVAFGDALSAYHHSLLTDKAALLAFRRAILFDPHSRLESWNEANDVCNFTGVSCGRFHHRVMLINLNASDLVGLLSPFISNLTQLRVLQLADNHLFGIIPPEISFLQYLRDLRLDNNSLYGSIPASLSFLSKLLLISLRGNKFSGTIPHSVFTNCTLLYNVDFSDNLLIGNIPSEIGNCPELWTLNLYDNQLTGEIPYSLTNASDLINLDVENNHLSGELPSVIVSKLHKLWFLHLSNNAMVSHDLNTDLEPFFTALSNCSRLVELELSSMGLGGRLSSSLARVGATLETLQLQDNRIIGSIPRDFGRFSNLTLLNLTANLLNGSITTEISKMASLEQLYLSHNMLTGDIPEALGQLSHLGVLDLSNNRLSGSIPRSLGNSINSLFLNNNLLSGHIPTSLGKCKGLYKVDLSFNKLTGSIPPEISEMRELRIFLNLSHNQLNGSLPIELSKLENVQEIDLSSNRLTGSIFYQISNCIALTKLNLSANNLEGHLPESLGEMRNLEVFDVSGNNLSGMIPTSLNKVHTLTFLNLSSNDLDGVIPSGGIFDSATNLSFLGNQHLCGHIPGIPACQTKGGYRVFIISASAFLSTICCLIGCRLLKRMLSPSQQPETEKKLPLESICNIPRIPYKELSDATGGFDESHLIGTGSYGCVYKGILPDGTPIAVKVLSMQTGNSMKSFIRECQVLRRIRHRNLIRLITACSLPDFKALVLPYMANGSLDRRLYPHPHSGSSDLSLMQRVNICSDIAEGLAYLHHHSPVKVIHCDLKPSNVLLNEDMTALVSDFGISKLVMTTTGSGNADQKLGNSTANMLCGSIGYIAPEYGFGSSTSTKGDVYSFGVLVLEMVTRKKPTDDTFGRSLSLHQYVKSEQMEIVDCSLMRALKEQSAEVMKMWEVAIRELIEVGMLCTQDCPSTRPTMLDAADDLNRLKRYLTGDTTATFASSLGISCSTLSIG
ncbi:PREDICTED: putative leucine-rich repeat receptor-like serine/threonine-protein kinase At2g24130 [Ipomoea nil]|uniref:putative leucine-rich repeat receptor-like serine/threonine-protein kinase At2g24130 n=1 Tax=Ipomoea nil TaxID=35883 RepID=UPI0009009915|nr:PREDICTED: putative leucine-rich repeat receptor-like serine/threonine-protein kinase At2g24130 [Ipomoea nil]